MCLHFHVARIFVFVLLLFSAIEIYAKVDTDSLVSRLSQLNETEEKVNLLLEIAKLSISKDPLASLSYGSYANKLSQNLDYPRGRANAQLYISYAYYTIDSMSNAVHYAKQAILDYHLIKDTINVAKCNNLIGVIYYKLSFYDKAIKSYLEALKYFEALKLNAKIDEIRFNIALTYFQTEQYDKAEHYWTLGLKSLLEDRKNYWEANIYPNLGLIYEKKGFLNKAMESQRKALLAAQQLKDSLKLNRIKNNIGNIYESEKKYNQAERYFKHSLDIAVSIDDKEGVLHNYKDLGELNYILKEYSKARLYLLKCADLSQAITNRIMLKEAFFYLSKVSEATGQIKKSLEYYKQFIVVKDSIFNSKSSEKLVQAQLKFDFEKIQQRKDLIQKKKDALTESEIKRQKLLRNASMMGIVMLMILAYVLYTRYRLKKSSNLKLQKKNEIIFKEKKKSEDLLHNILPVETANELKENGRVRARKYQKVSVGFTDFKGFTSLSEKLTPEALVQEIDDLFRTFDSIIAKYNLEKIKTIGDAYMFAGGIPSDLDNHPNVIVKACLEIRDSVERIKQEKIAKGELFFEIRIGVHTGPIVAGVVGTRKFAYDIWGDTVNTAARMESSGEVGKVNISGATYELIKDDYHCSFRGKIEAKNKGKVDMYFVEPKK